MELREYPGDTPMHPRPVDVVLPLRLRVDDVVWFCFSLDRRVGTTATDVTVDELAVECLYPADAATGAAMAALYTAAN